MNFSGSAPYSYFTYCFELVHYVCWNLHSYIQPKILAMWMLAVTFVTIQLENELHVHCSFIMLLFHAMFSSLYLPGVYGVASLSWFQPWPYPIIIQSLQRLENGASSRTWWKLDCSSVCLDWVYKTLDSEVGQNLSKNPTLSLVLFSVPQLCDTITPSEAAFPGLKNTAKSYFVPHSSLSSVKLILLLVFMSFSLMWQSLLVSLPGVDTSYL